MPTAPERIESNLAEVRRRIAEAAERSGRTEDAVRMIAVTKTVGIEEARLLHQFGVKELGENRLDTARPKIEALAAGIVWHMIGTVQRRKARDIVPLFDWVDSIDRVALAEALEKQCRDQDKFLPILIEVNVSGETSKHGFTPDTLPPALGQMARFEHLNVQGLMTMAPLVDDPEDTRPVFARLRELGDLHGLPELSMGMTNDFEVAIEEGATQVRIGSALFR